VGTVFKAIHLESNTELAVKKIKVSQQEKVMTSAQEREKKKKISPFFFFFSKTLIIIHSFLFLSQAKLQLKKETEIFKKMNHDAILKCYGCIEKGSTVWVRKRKSFFSSLFLNIWRFSFWIDFDGVHTSGQCARPHCGHCPSIARTSNMLYHLSPASRAAVPPRKEGDPPRH
jgi:serine/threonine protein kinase